MRRHKRRRTQKVTLSLPLSSTHHPLSTVHDSKPQINIWFADETSVQRYSSACKHHKLYKKKHRDEQAKSLVSRLSTHHISLMSCASVGGIVFDPYVIHAKASLGDSVNDPGFKDSLRRIGLGTHGDVLSGETGSFRKTPGSGSDNGEELGSFTLWCKFMAKHGHNQANLKQGEPVILILDNATCHKDIIVFLKG